MSDSRETLSDMRTAFIAGWYAATDIDTRNMQPGEAFDSVMRGQARKLTHIKIEVVRDVPGFERALERITTDMRDFADYGVPEGYEGDGSE